MPDKVVTLNIPIGSYDIKISKQGFITREESVIVSEDMNVSYPLDEEVYKLIIYPSHYGVEITVSDTGETKSFTDLDNLKPGRYLVKAKLDGFKPYSETIDIKNENYIMNIDLQPDVAEKKIVIGTNPNTGVTVTVTKDSEVINITKPIEDYGDYNVKLEYGGVVYNRKISIDGNSSKVTTKFYELIDKRSINVSTNPDIECDIKYIVDGFEYQYPVGIIDTGECNIVVTPKDTNYKPKTDKFNILKTSPTVITKNFNLESDKRMFNITVDQPDATISITKDSQSYQNNVEFEKSILGDFTITVTKVGYDTITKVITIDKKSPSVIRKDFKMIKTEEEKRQFNITVDQPDAIISITKDSVVYQNKTNFSKKILGNFNISISKEGYTTINDIITINEESPNIISKSYNMVIVPPPPIGKRRFNIIFTPADATLIIAKDDEQYQNNTEFNETIHGSFHISITKDGYNSIEEDIDVNGESPTVINKVYNLTQKTETFTITVRPGSAKLKITSIPYNSTFYEGGD